MILWLFISSAFLCDPKLSVTLLTFYLSNFSPISSRSSYITKIYDLYSYFYAMFCLFGKNFNVWPSYIVQLCMLPPAIPILEIPHWLIYIYTTATTASSFISYAVSPSSSSTSPASSPLTSSSFSSLASSSMSLRLLLPLLCASNPN